MQTGDTDSSWAKPDFKSDSLGLKTLGEMAKRAGHLLRLGSDLTRFRAN